MRRRLTLAILSSVFVSLTFIVILDSDEAPRQASLHVRDKLKIVVHLDFKGAPPRISYLEKLFPLMASAGATAILVEYEDMFPYEGTLRNVTSRNAYTKSEILTLTSAAKLHGLQVIPLVQTFGHLEFVLKLQEFKHLRELPFFPQELCPLNPESLNNLVYEMLKQVMALHPAAKYIHIGCDEVFHLGACSKCSHFDTKALFSDHVSSVARFIRSYFPGVTPLIWDDMLRRWSPAEHAKWGLGDLVEPVVWVYVDDIHSLLPHFAWHAYRRTFPRVWTAGAYKGTSGEIALVPDVRRHHLNTVSWLNIMKTCSGCKGFFLTGWSRYDHFAVLCELMPVSVPSLIHNLLLASRGDTHQISKILNCPQAMYISLDSESFHSQFAKCNFPGSDMLLAVNNLGVLKSLVEALRKKTSGWISAYNIKHNFSSPMRILECLSEVTQLSREVTSFRKKTESILMKYTDHFSVNEWLEQQVQPMEDEIFYLEQSMQKLLSIETWPRRPL